MNEAAYDFLLRHVGRRLFPGVTDPVKILQLGHPLLGLLKPTQARGFNGGSWREGNVVLATEQGITCDLSLSTFYSTEESLQQKRSEKTNPAIAQERIPQWLGELGIDRSFPIQIRVWHTVGAADIVVPDDVLAAYHPFPIQFMNQTDRTVSFFGARIRAAMYGDMRACAESGTPYMCCHNERSQDQVASQLALFHNVVGISTKHGVIQVTLRRLDLIESLSAFGVGALFFARALRRLQRGQTAPSPPQNGFSKDSPQSRWLRLTKRKNGSMEAPAWDDLWGAIRAEDSAFATYILEVAKLVRAEGLTEAELAAAEELAASEANTD